MLSRLQEVLHSVTLTGSRLFKISLRNRGIIDVVSTVRQTVTACLLPVFLLPLAHLLGL